MWGLCSSWRVITVFGVEMGSALSHGGTKCLTTKGQYFLSLSSGPSSHLQSYYPSCLAPGCHVTSQLFGCPDVAFQRTGLSEVSRTCLGAEEGLPWALTAAQDSVQVVVLGTADISRSVLTSGVNQPSLRPLLSPWDLCAPQISFFNMSSSFCSAYQSDRITLSSPSNAWPAQVNTALLLQVSACLRARRSHSCTRPLPHHHLGEPKAAWPAAWAPFIGLLDTMSPELCTAGEQGPQLLPLPWSSREGAWWFGPAIPPEDYFARHGHWACLFLAVRPTANHRIGTHTESGCAHQVLAYITTCSDSNSASAGAGGGETGLRTAVAAAGAVL